MPSVKVEVEFQMEPADHKRFDSLLASPSTDDADVISFFQREAFNVRVLTINGEPFNIIALKAQRAQLLTDLDEVHRKIAAAEAERDRPPSE
jgi:uncharacterized protein YhdP